MIVWMVIAGGVGALARFITDGLIRTVLGRRFPWGTLIINATGAFILGMVAGMALHQTTADFKLIVGTGFCGGFTTFSTASFETARLIEERRYSSALLQAFGNLGLAIAAAILGLWLAGWLN